MPILAKKAAALIQTGRPLRPWWTQWSEGCFAPFSGPIDHAGLWSKGGGVGLPLPLPLYAGLWDLVGEHRLDGAPRVDTGIIGGGGITLITPP